MKTTVKLALQQSDMRSRLKRDRSRLRIVKPVDLKRRVAATILAYERGWDPVRIADHFGWSRDDTARWVTAGKPLL